MGWEKRLPLAAVGRLLLPGASGSRRCGFGAAQPRLGLGVCVGIGASRARLPVTFPKLSSPGGEEKNQTKTQQKTDVSVVFRRSASLPARCQRHEPVKGG